MVRQSRRCVAARPSERSDPAGATTFAGGSFLMADYGCPYVLKKICRLNPPDQGFNFSRIVRGVIDEPVREYQEIPALDQVGIAETSQLGVPREVDSPVRDGPRVQGRRATLFASRQQDAVADELVQLRRRDLVILRRFYINEGLINHEVGVRPMHQP